MTWESVLEDLAAKVEGLERRLEAGAWEELDDTPFAPPDVEGTMTAEQRQRAVVLLERVAECRRLLKEGMQGAQQEIADIDARRRGARSYARSEANGG